MNIQVDFRSGQPIYAQIVEQIQRWIASGAIQPGDQLPTVRQLAADLRVNFNTIARAYRLLDEAGLISTQHGRGTYVWKTPSEETVRTLRQQSLQEQIQHFLRELIRRGYSPAEIGEEFKKGLMSEKENMT
ncbi:MAG: hypothetical protein B6D39_03785 [Anaerolineae bacterium UTCFX2]|jgi:GntR family transcriptional regulator|nr:GntR family transcriptional regulator [Anaerolineae bacterium]MCZ7552141.1 GntR family transcriptional regulator [Anaerolineales bacterium]OQY93015.1 MAG: hypothetical protein B6D39_03785 [Anaerolineae bacterium UTCFX2]